MVNEIIGVVRKLFAFALVLLSAAAAADALVIEPVPPSSPGASLSDFHHKISRDGRFIVYEMGFASASRLRLYDRQSGVTSSAVCVSSLGVDANDMCRRGAISGDGRYIAFDSRATNLVSGDTNGRFDVFVRDTVAGTTTRVSVDSSGNQGDSHSFDPQITPDGRYVVFWSGASNLVAGDTNNMSDVFVHDRVSETTERVSLTNSGGESAGESYRPVISDDGRYIAFLSDSSNLVAGDTNGYRDVFLRDRVMNTTIRVSVSSSGVESNDRNSDFAGEEPPSISGDGRYVAFISAATNLVEDDTSDDYDVFVHDRDTGITERISVGLYGEGGEYDSRRAYLSSDGRYVLFDSFSGFAGGPRGGVFLRDRLTATTRRLVSNEGSVGGSGFIGWRALSLNGHGDHAVVVKDYNFFPNPHDTKFVLTECGIAACGDGAISFGCEACDDGNSADLDGCNSRCELEACHTCSGEPTVCTPHSDGTACDDGNSCTPTQSCSGGQCVGANNCLNTLCPGSPDPCVVSSAIALPAGGTVDLGGRDLLVTSSGRLTSNQNGGSFGVQNAGSVTIEGGAVLNSSAVGVSAGAIGIESNGMCSLAGKIIANAALDKDTYDSGDGGAVTMRCELIELQEGSSIAADADWGKGGSIAIDATAGTLTIDSAGLRATGHYTGGGDIRATASGACSMRASVNVAGLPLKLDGESVYSPGGSVDVICGGNVSLAGKSTLILSSAAHEYTAAGNLTLQSLGGDVTVHPGVKLTNHGYDSLVRAAAMSIVAAGDCDFTGAIQSKSINGPGPGTSFQCHDVTINQKAKLTVTTTGSGGAGFNVDSTGACAIFGSIKLGAKGGAGLGRGGRARVDCDQGVSIGPKGVIDATGKGKSSSDAGSTGGLITVSSGTGSVFVAGKLIAKGKGPGGATTIDACAVNIEPKGKVLATGETGGTNTIVAHEDLTLMGTISAKGKIFGTNDLSYRTTLAMPQPKVVIPATVPAHNPGLSACP